MMYHCLKGEFMDYGEETAQDIFVVYYSGTSIWWSSRLRYRV